MMVVMKAKIMPVLLCAVMAGCGEQTKTEPRTPEEMYARVRELLQPNVEHDASEFEEAMLWLRRAAEGGLLKAQTDLGGIYLEGGKGGVQPDGREALRWFTAAAEQGSLEAQYYRGLILSRGMDVPADQAQAEQCWRLAAEGGVAEAQCALGLALLAQAGADAQEAVGWLTRAAGSKVPQVAARAACALGNIYAKGRPGVPRNMPEAARWYELAALGGDAAAQLVYGIMLLQGTPVPQDTAQGMRFLRLAAGQDNAQAIALLVNMLRLEGAEDEAAAWADRLKAISPATSAEQSAH